MNDINEITENSKDYTFYNPTDTASILYREIQKNNSGERRGWCYKCVSDFAKNPALLFSKIIPEPRNNREKVENKDKHLQFLSNEFKKSEILKIIDNINERCALLFNNFLQNGYRGIKLKAVCSWRLVIGLGASHPEETSMTLHHIYGIPYIPGSAIKGVTRHWSVIKFADEKAKKEGKNFDQALKEVAKALEVPMELNNLRIDNIEFKDLTEIFGNQNQQGKVIFMDAFPAEEISFKIDIMNPHYQEYYSGSRPPADWQNPTPIKFLTMENTRFNFILLSQNEHLLEVAQKLLKEALSNHGIGAKTSLGYGILQTI